MMNKMMSLVKEEQGQGMTEYGLVLSMIAIGALAALIALRGQIEAMFNTVRDAVMNRPQ